MQYRLDLQEVRKRLKEFGYNYEIPAGNSRVETWSRDNRYVWYTAYDRKDLCSHLNVLEGYTQRRWSILNPDDLLKLK